MAYLGQSPFGQTVRTTTSVVATAGQTTVYPTGGYTIGYIDVWVNGAKLTENSDFTANDGLSVVFSPALDLNDQVECIAYGSFSFVDAVKRSGDTMAGTLNVQSLIPTSNNLYNLGSTTARFNDIYLSNSSIYLGDLILSSNATNVLLSNSSGLIGTMATGGGIDTFQYTAANATISVTTTNGASYSATLNVGNSSTAGILQIVDTTSNSSATVAASANSVKVAYDAAVTAQGLATNAYSNAVSYADAKAANAYSNAINYAATAAATAYSNAVSAASSDATTKAATAYTNAVAYAAANTYVNSNFVKLTDTRAISVGNTTINGDATVTANLSANNVRATGSVQIDGDLTVSGNTVTVNATNLSLEDNMIYLNANNNVSNPDLGIAGNYNDGTYKHAGFFRDATDGVWKVFDGYTPEPDASAYIDTANATFRIADFQANAFTSRIISTGNTTITGYANVTTTLAAGNTTITGFINVSTSVAAANINTSGTVSADIITVSNVSQTQTNLQVDPAGTAFLNALIYG